MKNRHRFQGAAWIIVAALAVVGLAGCGPSTPAAQQSRREDALLAVQHAFAQLSADRGLGAAFARYAADDAILLPAGYAAIQGHDAIVDALKKDGGGRVRWSADAARVAGSDDLGGTWGGYVASGQGDSGATVGYGKFLAVWGKRDGDWRIVAFMVNESPGRGVR